MGRLLLLCFCTLAFSFAAFGEARGADLENPQRELDVFKELTAYNRFRAKEADYIRILDVIKSTRGIPEYDAADILTSASSKDFAKAEAKVKETLERLKERAEKGDEWAQVALLIYERKNNPPNAENDKKLIEFAERGNASACYALVCRQSYIDRACASYIPYEFNLPSEDMRLKYEKTARDGGLLKRSFSRIINDSKFGEIKVSEVLELIDKVNIKDFRIGEIGDVAQFYIDVSPDKNRRQRALDLLWFGTKRGDVPSAVKLAFLYSEGSEKLGVRKSEEKVEEVANALDERLRGGFYLNLYEVFIEKFAYRSYYESPSRQDDVTWRIEKIKNARKYVAKAAECGNLRAEFMCAMDIIGGGAKREDFMAFSNLEKLPLERQREFIARMSALRERVSGQSSLGMDIRKALVLFYLKAHESLRDEGKAVSILENNFSETGLYLRNGILILYLMYNEGCGVAKDEAKARHYFEKYKRDNPGISDLYNSISLSFSKSKELDWFNVVAPKNDALSKKYMDLCFEASEDGEEEARLVRELAGEDKYDEAKKHIEHLAIKKTPAYYLAAISYFLYHEDDKQKLISLMLERVERYPDSPADSNFSDEEFLPYLALLSGAYGLRADKPAAESYLKKICESRAVKNGNSGSLDEIKFKILNDAFEHLCFNSMGLDFDRRAEILKGIFDEIKDKRASSYEDFSRFYMSRKNYEKAAEYLKEYVVKANVYRSLFGAGLSERNPEHMKFELDILKVAAERNIPAALLIMSVLHREGRFVEKDTKLADELLKKLPANIENWWFTYLYYGCWPWGKSIETAYKLDCTQADLNNVNSLLRLMFSYMGYGPYAGLVDRDDAKVFECAKKLEKGDALVCFLYLHILYDRGIAPFKKNEELAKKYAEAYDRRFSFMRPPFYLDLQREIFDLNAEGSEYFEGGNHEYALRVCEKSRTFSGAELNYLSKVANGFFSDRAKYFSRAMGILEKASENGNYKARQYYVEGQICEALRKKDYALALKIIEENSELKIDDTAYLIKIALHLSEENSPLGKSAVEKICAKPHWASDVESCLKYDKYELRDEENLIKRVNALFVGQKDTRDFSKIEPFVRRVTNPEYKRIDLKKYYK